VSKKKSKLNSNGSGTKLKYDETRINRRRRSGHAITAISGQVTGHGHNHKSERIT
jgi:hypothetical protein